MKHSREALNNILLSTSAPDIPARWNEIKPLIAAWWTGYKRWEAKDTFKNAYDQKRVTVRSFTANFSEQLRKSIPKGTLNIPLAKFYADSQRTPLRKDVKDQYHREYHTGTEHQKYWQDRGIDSAAFANPANFTSREAKYAHGLHDLSASLINPEKPINLQLFSAGDGVLLAFSPLSKEEDQQVVWKLTGLAKVLQGQLPEFHFLVRGYRAEMTRVKLARDYDIGTGFIATKIADPGQGPQFKLTYGLGSTIKEKGQNFPRSLSQHEQVKLKFKLRQEAMQFKNILNGVPLNAKQTNEIVISLRKHAGPFPVYAVLRVHLGYCECFDIVGDNMVINGRQISIENGTMT